VAADVALAVENGLNGGIISDRGWWERWGDLPGCRLTTVVVGGGGGEGRHAGCSRDAAG
jgi:hypothetical protein